MKYILFDMEWNQPLVPKKKVNGLYGEIIQIGAIKTDENLKEIDELNLPAHVEGCGHKDQLRAALQCCLSHKVCKADVETDDDPSLYGTFAAGDSGEAGSSISRSRGTVFPKDQ